MIWAKKKKILILTGSLVTVLAIPQFASIPFYIGVAESKTVNINGENRSVDIEIISGASGAKNFDNSNTDKNLKELKPNSAREPIVTIDPPKPEDPTLIGDKPAETPKPITPVAVIPTDPVVHIDDTPVTETPPVVSPKPSPEKPPKEILPISNGSFIPGPDEEIREVQVFTKIYDPTIRGVTDKGDAYTGGYREVPVNVKIIAKKVPPRHKFSPAYKEIENRKPYSAEIAPEIVNIEVTPEYIDALRTSYLNILKYKIENDIGIQADRNTGVLINWTNRSGIPKDQIDWNNLELTADAVEKIKKGYVLSPDNLYLNESGKVDSNSWGPLADAYNNTKAVYTRDNTENRFFGYKTWYKRLPDDIDSGNFPGWTKKDVKNDWIKFGLSKSDGIEVLEYTNNDPVFANRNNSIRVVLDAANEEGYDKYIKFLKNVENDKTRKISSFVIKNMGSGVQGTNQKFIKILEALPNHVPNLELWLENPDNTSFLIALRNKKIDELAFYTTQNSLLDRWSINPLSVQNTAYIQANDYNVSNDFAEGYKPKTRLSFKTIAFDPINYNKNGTTDAERFKDINLGLAMAYYVRNNESFFHGPFGRGIESADNSEKTNTIWPGLDLSRIPQLKSLRGLNFEFGEGDNKFTRFLARLTLYNDSSVFTISTDELNKSQFNKVMAYTGDPRGAPTDRLAFKGANVNAIRIVNTPGEPLTREGLENLETFYRQVGKDVFGGREIYVNKDDETTKSVLEQNGYNTKVYNAKDKDINLT